MEEILELLHTSSGAAFSPVPSPEMPSGGDSATNCSPKAFDQAGTHLAQSLLSALMWERSQKPPQQNLKRHGALSKK